MAWKYGLALTLSMVCCTAIGQARPKPPASICIDGKCTPEVSTGGLKWNPGHYMLTDANISTSQQISHIAELATKGPGVKGAQVRIWWGEIETSKNVYNWTCIDSFLNAAKVAKKQLVVQVMDRRFGTSSTSIRTGCGGKAYPQYLLDESKVAFGGFANNGNMAKVWEEATMSRYIALLTAILNRYDEDNNLEMITTEEINPGFQGGPPPPGTTFTNAALGAQWIRMIAEVAAVRKRTQLNTYPNALSGQLDGAGKVFEAIYEHGWAAGAPDIIPDNPPPGDNVMVGHKESPDFTPGGYRDYRGKIAVGQAVQSPELGGKEGTFTAAELARRAVELGITHVFWLRMTWNAGTSTSAQMWSTGLLPYINENPNILGNRCPTTLEKFGGCDSGNSLTLLGQQ